MDSLTALPEDPRFRIRDCPSCGHSARAKLLDLPAASFCLPNPTYARDSLSMLGVSNQTRFPIDRCIECGFVYAIYEPNREFLDLLYDKVISHEQNQEINGRKASYARRMRYVADLLELAPSKEEYHALDFGCGVGITLRILQAAGVRSVGYDNSAVRSQYLSDAQLPVAKTLDGLAEHGPFDLLVCDNVLEHLPYPAKTLHFLASVSAPGAVLYVSVPDCNGNFLARQADRVRSGCPLDMSMNPWEHLNYFDLPRLDHMLDSAGFSPIADEDLPSSADIGLRPEANSVKRIKNALASALRLVRYASTGSGHHNPTKRFYRLKG